MTQSVDQKASAAASATDAWLSAFQKALTARDADAAAALFADESYWRDIVSFTWNITTVEGGAGVADLLRATLDEVDPVGFRVTEEPAEEDGVITAWIAFETKAGRGSGLLRLVDGKAFTLLTTLDELKGHEEPVNDRRPNGVRHGAFRDRVTWAESRAREATELGYTVQPEVLIVGGGQGGIALGARLRQLGVPTIIVERNERPGDSWRKRYKSLALHDPVWYDHLPYLPFPANWPVFSPKDKIGDWLEMYAKVMELNYWGSTTCKSAVREGDGWAVVVDRAGEEITLRPRQLVLALGASGLPIVPEFPGREKFRGDQHHSSAHPGPDKYKGKKAVVIGSNNSAHDICAALWEAGADVTMVQRSSTHVVRSDSLMDLGLGDLYSERAVAAGMTTFKADTIFASLPFRILPALQTPVYNAIRERDAEYYGRLEQAGFDLDFGDDDSGPVPQVPAARVRLLHRRRRLRACRERRHQAGQGAGGRADRGRGRPRRRHPAPGRSRRLRDGLRLHEPAGRRHHRPGHGRQGREGLGARLGHDEGPGPVGGRAAQHVEADGRRRACGSTAATSPCRATTPSTWPCSSKRAWRASRRPSTSAPRCTTPNDSP